MSDWQKMDTAPTDGRWICVIKALTLVGRGPFRTLPEALIIRRERHSPDSAGYWMSIAGHSVADSFVRCGLWSDIDALPLRDLCEASEQERRAQGGDPHGLPVPYGTGLPEQHQ